MKLLQNRGRSSGPIIVAAAWLAHFVAAAGLAQTVQPAPFEKSSGRSSRAEPRRDAEKTNPLAKGGTILIPSDAVLSRGLTLQIQNEIITSAVSRDGQEKYPKLLGRHYVPGDIDATDLVPLLWRTISLEIGKGKIGGRRTFTLTRPIWWLQENRARLGKTIELDMPEFGAMGMPKITRISACDWKPDQRSNAGKPIIGRFEHEDAVVWDLFFANRPGKPSTFTAFCHLQSLDHPEPVEIDKLKTNEKVRLNGENLTLVRKSQRPGRHSITLFEHHRAEADADDDENSGENHKPASKTPASKKATTRPSATTESAPAGKLNPKTTVVTGVKVRNFDRVVVDGKVDLKPTIDRINAGEKFAHRNDGSIFGNREGRLPRQSYGYYHEYVVPTPGVSGPGPQRLIVGKKSELFYSPDHYETFIPVR